MKNTSRINSVHQQLLLSLIFGFGLGFRYSDFMITESRCPVLIAWFFDNDGRLYSFTSGFSLKSCERGMSPSDAKLLR